MKKGTSLILIAVSVICLWTAGHRHGSLLQMRALYRLDSAEPLENAPPLVVFTTVALGGFRGLLADGLWLRASYLQDRGKYLEMVQLSNWITKLEPRFTEVWAFHARNMAFNASTMMLSPEDRWRWIKNAIQLLRDEGLRYNPTDAGLHCELGWLYQFKIGGTTDWAGNSYRKMWADEMATLFDGPKPDYDKLAAEPAASRRMLEEYKLIPEVMRRIDSQYGPVDWRLPEAHAIYWAYQGRKHAGPDELLLYDRMIFQSMAASFRRGRLVSAPDDDVLRVGPNLDILPNTIETYESAFRKYNIESVRAAYANFLANAVWLLNDLGKDAKAREMFSLLHRRFPAVKTSNYESFVKEPVLKLPGCRPGEKLTHESWKTMGTFVDIAVHDHDKHLLKDYASVAKRTFGEMENILSVFKPDSEISKMNRSAGKSSVPISLHTRDMLKLALKYAEISNGCFDPTIEPLVRFWGFSTKDVPDKIDVAGVRAAMRNVGYKHLILTEDSARLDKTGMHLNLGGIAKGYAIDICYDKLRALGAVNMMINLGGNIKCHGTSTEGKPWTIGVRNPFQLDKIVGTIELSSDMAIATSGNYEQFVTIGGERYTHIIDPRNGYPVKGMAGVTVISASATEADAMSTSLFVLGMTESKTALKRTPGCHALFIPDKQPMQIWVTPGFMEYFKPNPDLTDAVRKMNIAAEPDTTPR